MQVIRYFSDFLTRYSCFFRIFAPEMLQKAKQVARTLSFRLSLMVIAALATLLMVALLVMFFFSRKAVKEEALRDAEQTLEATVLNIDNILLSVEQASGNVYWKILRSLQLKDGREELYARKLVETNPYISDCRLVWDTDNQETGTLSLWTDPVKGSAVTSFRLPLFDGQQRAGTMVVDVSLSLLSKIVLDAKPSPNSFSTLLGRDGSYIVHPDDQKLNRNVFELAKQDDDPSVEEAARAMVAGETGYRYVRLNGNLAPSVMFEINYNRFAFCLGGAYYLWHGIYCGTDQKKTWGLAESSESHFEDTYLPPCYRTFYGRLGFKYYLGKDRNMFVGSFMKVHSAVIDYAEFTFGINLFSWKDKKK